MRSCPCSFGGSHEQLERFSFRLFDRHALLRRLRRQRGGDHAGHDDRGGFGHHDDAERRCGWRRDDLGRRAPPGRFGAHHHHDPAGRGRLRSDDDLVGSGDGHAALERDDDPHDHVRGESCGSVRGPAHLHGFAGREG